MLVTSRVGAGKVAGCRINLVADANLFEDRICLDNPMSLVIKTKKLARRMKFYAKLDSATVIGQIARRQNHRFACDVSFEEAPKFAKT